MRNQQMKLCCLLAGLIAAAALPLAAQQNPMARALSEPWPRTVKVDGIEILHVQKNIYLLAGAGGYVTAQIGDEGVFLVDSGAAGQADKLVAAIRTLTDKRIRYLVNTSGDADHVGGNEGIVKEGGGVAGVSGENGLLARPNYGVLTYAHYNAVQRMTADAPGFTALKGEAVPDSTFEGPHKDMYANGEAVQLLSQPNAHTDGDILVFFRGSDVISAGEVYRTDSYPVIDVAKGGSVQGEINALNTILDLAIPERNQMGGTRVIPAHGHVANEADVLEYRDMLTIMRNRVRAMVAKNMTLAQVKEAHPAIEYDPLYGHHGVTTDQMLEIMYNEETAKKGK